METTRQIVKTVKKETRIETFHSECFYEQHYSSSSTSSCGSLKSFTAVNTKTGSCVRDVHFAARAMFPEFFEKTAATKRLMSSGESSYSSISTSSCASLDSLTAADTKTESCVREVHFAARSMFPEFFEKTATTKRFLSSKSSHAYSYVMRSSVQTSEPRKNYRELDDRIKNWFIKEYGLEISCH